MSRFPPPDIDPNLTAEARAVVDSAAASMRSWIDKSLSQIETETVKEIESLSAEIEKQIAANAAEDERKLLEIEGQLQSLERFANDLTDLDEDQRKVKEQLTQASQLVRTELKARSERWQGVGQVAVKSASKALKTSLGIV